MGVEGDNVAKDLLVLGGERLEIFLHRHVFDGVLEPEDGKLWVLDIDGVETLAFSEFGIETLREIIADQVDRKRRP